MKRETIERLIREYTGDDLAGYLRRELNEEERIREELARIDRVMSRAAAEHEKHMNRLVEQGKIIASSCPHHERSIHPVARRMMCELCEEEIPQ